MRCGSAGDVTAAPPAFLCCMVVRTGSVDAMAAGCCSFCGGMGGAPSGEPSGPSGSSSTAWSLVGCATRRRGVRRDGRGPLEVVEEVAAAVRPAREEPESGSVSVLVVGASSSLPVGVGSVVVIGGGWAGVSAQGDSPRGSMVVSGASWVVA